MSLVITGARVYTPGMPAPRSAAVALAGERIAAVGDERAVRELGDRRTEVLHAPGGLVLPGFQDAHVHLPLAGRNLLTVALDGLAGVPQYLEAVATYAAAHPDEAWITGGGWAMEHFPGGTPHRRDLDAVVGDRPVFLYNRDVHGAWVSSRTLELAGITRETPDPPDGRIERDADGEPTGCLHEGAATRLEAELVPPADPDDVERAILLAQQRLLSLGVTAWQDAWVTPPEQNAYVSLASSGRLVGRAVGALWWDRDRGLEQVEELVDRSGYAAPGFSPTTVKIMVDGVVENATAALLEPYCGCHSGSGLVYVPPEVLRDAAVLLDAAGFQLHLHAIGDRAVRLALDSLEAARRTNGARDSRHHVAHLQVVDPADVPRFARLGVVATVQAYWAQEEPQMTDLTLPVLGPDRSQGQYPFASLLRSGARLAMGSDWPVTTPDPLRQIEVAVTRVDDENRANPPFLPAERLTLREAVDAFTAGSAFVNGDDSGGAVLPGRRADLAVLDTDVFAADAGPVGDARVAHTVVAGRAVHSR